MGKEVSTTPFPWNRSAEEGKEFYKLAQKSNVQLEAPSSFCFLPFAAFMHFYIKTPNWYNCGMTLMP